ncbi:MAG: PilT/PilU family type 4a pilus ATPase [Candidatus Omnitrophica bacterium]|nr:PilT/PilU family type 4a pilus ATPase [Candidatus Omnitrophota bacterium]MDE2008644.1 PilT/PilU family type 4a pilus ATPase [Candidatus Omnitrophota bacterium]MDE2214973.1 PilT/PilU family type 4a pilus ATPase [Candidatus Omnitrophota bacterium]MDE2230912.1 PilT/PilU family type 4a pilus ATPase [Candidatus Omnitrophota bacterium]
MDYTKVIPLLNKAIECRATDIHLVVERPPVFRINGSLSASDLPPLKSEDIQNLLFDMMTEAQRKTFMEIQDIDLSYIGIKNFNFRVNGHFEKGRPAANIRILPTVIPTAEQLGLPAIVERLAHKRKGFIIICGSAGSGKTTTMNYMVDCINRARPFKIVMIEDPIEHVHESRKSLIIQREVGTNTRSFASALKHALRQDPDVVVVGEIRDAESISMALTTAETGHLVLTTLHAPDTVESINRILDVYPPGKQDQIRSQLAENLTAVIGQILIPLPGKEGRILATEVLVPTLSIRNIIRRGALLEIRGQMATADEGMYTFEQCLSQMIKTGIITKEYAKEFSKFPNYL